MKNSIAEGQAKAKSGIAPRTASQGELEVYSVNARLLRMIGCDVAEDKPLEITGFTLPEPPHIVSLLRCQHYAPLMTAIRSGFGPAADHHPRGATKTFPFSKQY